MDFFLKLEGMTEEQVQAEIEKISDKMLRSPPGSAMYKGLLGLYEQAQIAYTEKVAARRMKAASENSKVIELGEVKSEVKTPDYSMDELVNAVVHAYLSGSDE